MEGPITFGSNVLQVEGVEIKYDIVPVSNSLALVIGDKDSASVVQQLYYWLKQGYGEVINGTRWIYKPIKEWIEEVFPTYTPYQLGKMMKELVARGIIRREKLFTKHQIQNGDRFWWQPKNQTYYYTLNYDKLQELGKNFVRQLAKRNQPEVNGKISIDAETPENSVFIKTQILSNKEFQDTKDFDCAKNITENTSIENKSTDRSHPTLPCESERKKEVSQKQELSNPVPLEVQQTDLAGTKAIGEDTNDRGVEEKVNQYKNTDSFSTQLVTDKLQKSKRPSPKLKGTKTKQKRGMRRGSSHLHKAGDARRENKAPWKDETEKSQFYRALIQALPIVANSHSPQGLAKTIIAQLKRGEEHTYWDDFAAGLPIGTSTKPEWEVEPGVPYPMFIEYLTEKLKPGNNTKTDEQVRNEVFRILSQPRQAKAFWGQFKRSVVNVSEQVERDRALGVSNPNTPVWTRERIEPSVEEAAEAGEKIMAVNDGERAIAPLVSKTLAQTEPPQIESKPESLPTDPWTEKSSDKPEPSSFSEDKPESKPDAQRSGANLAGQPSLREMLAARGVKGFCKSMPKVSKEEAEAEERARTKPKMNIATMAIAEINDYLTDPILRAQLTPQLMQSAYELITDELGQIIAVKLSELQIRERRSLSSEE